MEIDEDVVGDRQVLILKGKLLMGDGCELVRERVDAALSRGVRSVVLDLAQVPYMDSAGLGEIVRCLATGRRFGGSITVQNPSARVRELLVRTAHISTIH